MKKTIILILTSTLLQLNSFAKIDVVVGGYDFPPFISASTNSVTGMTIDLIQLLNSSQSKFHFKFYPTTAKRRYKDFNDKKYDLIFFESIAWDWKREEVVASKVILTGGEVFITKATPERTQKFFESLSNKKVLGIPGYHYKFANFVSDRDYLEKYFNMEFGERHQDNILSVLRQESPTVAIVTKSYLNQFLDENPEYKDKLLISSKVDQHYNHTILIRKKISPNLAELNNLLERLEKAGELEKLWNKYGIKK